MVGPQNEMFEVFDTRNMSMARYYNSTPFAAEMGIMNLYPFSRQEQKQESGPRPELSQKQDLQATRV